MRRLRPRPTPALEIFLSPSPRGAHFARRDTSRLQPLDVIEPEIRLNRRECRAEGVLGYLGNVDTGGAYLFGQIVRQIDIVSCHAHRIHIADPSASCKRVDQASRLDRYPAPKGDAAGDVPSGLGRVRV